jgi:hypothetical protein
MLLVPWHPTTTDNDGDDDTLLTRTTATTTFFLPFCLPFFLLFFQIFLGLPIPVGFLPSIYGLRCIDTPLGMLMSIAHLIGQLHHLSCNGPNMSYFTWSPWLFVDSPHSILGLRLPTHILPGLPNWLGSSSPISVPWVEIHLTNLHGVSGAYNGWALLLFLHLLSYLISPISWGSFSPISVPWVEMQL